MDGVFDGSCQPPSSGRMICGGERTVSEAFEYCGRDGKKLIRVRRILRRGRKNHYKNFVTFTLYPSPGHYEPDVFDPRGVADRKNS